MNLLEVVSNFLKDRDWAGSTGVVAVSGGADSVALAHLLITLEQGGALGPIHLAHLNHQLRGADSEADADFVRGLAERWGKLPTLHTHALDIAARARQARANLEETARDERYRWLTSVAQQVSARWIATGHTADDQAETVLLRLLRGSGLQGLTAIAPARPASGGISILRPLLQVRRETLHRYLLEQGLPHREDSSNQDVTFTRNRIRHQLLPLLARDYNHAIVETLGRLASQAAEVQRELDAGVEGLRQQAECPRAGRRVVIRSAALASASPLLIRELFRSLWRREQWPMDQMDAAQWGQLEILARGTLAAWDFPGGIRARHAGAFLQLGPGEDIR